MRMLKKINTPTLETQRLLLRKAVKQDREAFLEIFKDDTIHRYRPWFPLTTIKEASQYLESYILPVYERDIAYYYVLEEKTSKKVIGFISLDGLYPGRGIGEFNAGMIYEYRGKGYLKEAANALLHMAKENGFTKISAIHDKENVKSGEIIKDLGLSYRYSFDERKPHLKKTVTFQYYEIKFD
jgi:[ribosomal protein S5]-alanine N-acetyltransferase